jgi:hypothetical protein
MKAPWRRGPPQESLGCAWARQPLMHDGSEPHSIPQHPTHTVNPLPAVARRGVEARAPCPPLGCLCMGGKGDERGARVERRLTGSAAGGGSGPAVLVEAGAAFALAADTLPGGGGRSSPPALDPAALSLRVRVCGAMRARVRPPRPQRRLGVGQAHQGLAMAKRMRALDARSCRRLRRGRASAAAQAAHTSGARRASERVQSGFLGAAWAASGTAIESPAI